MRIETFRKRAVGKINAAIFLADHRDFLMAFPSVLPVLAQLEKRMLMPTQALQQIVTLMALEKDPIDDKVEVVHPKTGEVKEKTVASVEKAAKKKVQKKYQLFLFVKEEGGMRIHDKVEEASTYQEAMNIAYLRLFHHGNAMYMDVIGLGVTTRITRDDAMREMLGKRRGGVMATKTTGTKSAALTGRATVKNFVAKFSRG